MSACPNPICGHDAASHGRDGCYTCACSTPRARAHARNTDPITSHLAAMSVDLSRGQQLILNEFHFGLELHGYPRPMTDEELVGKMSRLSPSGARSRRAELTSMGLLVDTGGKVQGASGRWMIQWGLASWAWEGGVPLHKIVEGGDQMALPL